MKWFWRPNKRIAELERDLASARARIPTLIEVAKEAKREKERCSHDLLEMAKSANKAIDDKYTKVMELGDLQNKYDALLVAHEQSETERSRLSHGWSRVLAACGQDGFGTEESVVEKIVHLQLMVERLQGELYRRVR